MNEQYEDAADCRPKAKSKLSSCSQLHQEYNLKYLMRQKLIDIICKLLLKPLVAILERASK